VAPCVNINAKILTVSSQFLAISLALASGPPSTDLAFRLQVLGGECVLLRENDLAIMATTIFKVPAAALHLLVIACIMLVAVQVTEAARELDHGAGGVLLNRDQVASADTKAALTVFQATACKLLHLPRGLQFSSDDECFSNDHRCVSSEDCCSGSAILILFFLVNVKSYAFQMVTSARGLRITAVECANLGLLFLVNVKSARTRSENLRRLLR
jgi:hypothetical protein